MAKAKNHLKFRQDFNIGHLETTVAEEDPNLSMYYVSAETFVARALDREDKASVFIGPKGVGKSAVLQMVRCDQRASGNAARIIEVKPDDLAFNALVNVDRTSPILSTAKKNQFLFTALWNYVLCTEVLRNEATPSSTVGMLLQSIFGERHKKEQSQLLKLAESDGRPTTMTDKMLALVDAVHLEGGAGGFEGKASVELREPASSKNAGDLKLLQLINNVAKALPTKINHEYFILIDDLDLHWTGSELQNAFLGALFFSIRRLSADRKIKFVVSLRRNIYREVHLEERDKFSSYVVRVSWARDSVKRMIQRRLAFVFNTSESQIWGGMFESGAFDQIWNHTDGMPREAIRLVAHCILAAKTDSATSVGASHLSEGLLSFSEDRLDELGSLHQHEYPELAILFRQFRGRRKEFDLETIQESCFALTELSLPPEQCDRLSWATNGFEYPLSVARVLLRIGFLLLKDGRSAIAKPASEEDILLLDKTRWFSVHAMYQFGLGLDGAE